LRKHRIADGDSLELIALRYLGDKERANEIAALNRDVFSDPALLPVGREIAIPGEDSY
jgi:nucleoid-associated protein YgaU